MADEGRTDPNSETKRIEMPSNEPEPPDPIDPSPPHVSAPPPAPFRRKLTEREMLILERAKSALDLSYKDVLMARQSLAFAQSAYGHAQSEFYDAVRAIRLDPERNFEVDSEGSVRYTEDVRPADDSEEDAAEALKNHLMNKHAREGE